MVLSQAELREEVQSGRVRFDPPLLEKQWNPASINLRLGANFTKIKTVPGIKISLSQGIKNLSGSGLWQEEELSSTDSFGKKRSYCLEPNEFVLALTHEHIYMPRNLIAMVEGRSTYARFGLSMHQTAPWLQPGWDGRLTLEIRNSGPLQIELTPIEDMPCQLTFFRLSSEIPEDSAYGSRPSDAFQSQGSALPTKKP